MDSERTGERKAIPIYMYVTDHQHSRVVGEAFAIGANAPIVPASRLREEGAAAVYGRLRGCENIIASAIAQGRDWYYIDRGYMRSTRDTDYSGYFRVTRNELQSDGFGEPNKERFLRLKIQLHSWRKEGGHVLLCPPGDVYGRLSGFDAAKWTRDALDLLRANTKRPIYVREKPRDGKRNAPLTDDLRDCWAVVVHSSNVGVEAILRGIPVFATDRCAASRMARSNLARIEDPYVPPDDSLREEWAATLAAQQWTIAEMRDGTCWTDLQKQKESPR